SPQTATAAPRPGGLVAAFATPVLSALWQDLLPWNDALATHIQQLAAEDAGVTRSNVGGWHSGLNFFADPAPAVQALSERICAQITALRQATAGATGPGSAPPALTGWANRIEYGDYHSIHCHPDAQWSGVYYVTGNDSAGPEHPFSGKLELLDPRQGGATTQDDRTNLYGRFLIDPQPGQVVIFPGWLQHQVHPYFGQGARLTVAFNVR
ncbi:MAG: TIGR02466 family protein, partial [Pseudomonadota bacterium]